MSEQFIIAEYDEISSSIDVVKEAANFIPDVTSKDGYLKSKRVSLDIGQIKTTLEETRKRKKKYYLDGGRVVDSQAKAIFDKLDKIQEPHTLAYKKLDNEKKEREAKRKQVLEDRVAFIRTLPESLAESSSDEVMGAIEEMAHEECTDYYEYTEMALKARNATKDALAKLYTKKSKDEKDAEELEALRRDKIIQDQKERDERITREAAAKAEQGKIDAIQRQKEAENRAIEAERIAKENSELAEQERKNALHVADMERLAADDRAKRYAEKVAEDEKIAAENAVVFARDAAEKARLDEIKHQENIAEQKRLEQEKREADIEHKGAINRQVCSNLISVADIDMEQAKKIVTALAKRAIAGVTINY